MQKDLLKNATAGANNGSLLEQYFEANFLNQNFIVTLATNNGTDLTSSYNNLFLII